MARILRTNSRHMAELCHNQNLPSPLEQTLLLTGFSAEMNLLRIAEALSRRDHRPLELASDRNAKLGRLREEVCTQVAAERRKLTMDSSASQKLALIANSAISFERMGAQTEALAALCEKITRHPIPSRVTEIKKLIEHSVQMADSTCAALVYEQSPWVKGALEEGRAALLLSEQIERDLASLRSNKPDSATRVDLLESVVSKINQIIEDINEMATKVTYFLEEANVHV